MKRTVSFIAAIDITFVGLLVISSMLSGTVSDIIYYLAFALPILLGAWAIGYKKAMISSIHLKGDIARFALPLIFPTIAAVSLLAFLTSLALSLFGYENPASFEEPFTIAILTRAFLPAVLEEILFRYIPIKLLKAEGASTSFIVSFTSLAFAVAHTNLFRIPYAALAGAVFALLFVATGSIIPCALAHFLNNVISLIAIYYEFDLWVYISLSIAAVLSLIFVFLKRDIYKSRVKELFSERMNFTSTATFAVYITICLALAILTLNTN